ncbi:MAG: PorT family protein [Tannerellaceae bacterium]|nr:PorT family protein [Tannerellaceae bacterium]
MRKSILLITVLWSCLVVSAQSRTFLIENKIFNFGATIGLKSSLPVINSLIIDGRSAENIQMQYRVGYTASLFGRINIDHFFLQPSISWHHSSSELRFSFPTEGENVTPVTSTTEVLDMTFKSIEIPVLLGYKIIKEGPYGLSLMAGPQIKYNYKTDYTFNFTNSRNSFSADGRNFDVNIVTGVGVSIWRLFFDFKYEFGLNRMDTDFRNLNPSESALLQDIEINKRINVMSFSLGLLF